MDYLGVSTSEKKVAELMRLGDVFIYPTIHMEGLGLSVAEAMASGLPVVTTEFAASKTGMKDLVFPGKTGVVFDHLKQPAAISDILADFDENKIRHLGENARQRIYDLKMDVRQVSLQWRDVYCELLNKYHLGCQ